MKYSLTVSSDVARPDKISGADINAICQEVSYIDDAVSFVPRLT